METHRKGDFTEATVLAELKRRSIPVSIPFGDNERYDFVVEADDGALYKAQVKTGWLSGGVVDFHGKSQHTNSRGNVYEDYNGDVDHFLVYVHELDALYLVPDDEFDWSISLRVDTPEQADASINWADDYAFDERWPPSVDEK